MKHCHQYERKLQTYQEDVEHLKMCGISEQELQNVKIEDLDFFHVTDRETKFCKDIKDFIERYEWLGKVHIYTTHRFVAYYKEHLVCAILMATPNKFSNLLGKQNTHLEKLISRGASVSWAPKNIASWMLAKSIDWMVNNTPYRIFTAYSDPEALELGTVYQASNFYYLGQESGATTVYKDPKREHLGWISSRSFTYRSCYVNYARELGIEWNHNEWYRKGTRKIDWSKVPDDVEIKLKQYAKDYMNSCPSRKAHKKHKYAYVKGVDKSETYRLRQLFEELNKKKIKEYPKNRGN